MTSPGQGRIKGRIANTLSIGMGRREFIALLGSAAATWPLLVRAQQAAVPVVGFLHSLSPKYFAGSTFRVGLQENGYTEGRNVLIEYRWAEGRYDKLPALAGELVARNVAVILAGGGTDPAKAAKAATDTIPIVFVSAADPVKAGLVASLNRPGGNVTGVSLIGSSLEPKRLELLVQLVPAPVLIGVLVNPMYPDADLEQRELQEASDKLNREIVVVTASTELDLQTAFARLVEARAGALLVAQDPFLVGRRERIVELANRHNLPAVYHQREFAEVGGLVSYGTNFAEGYRQAAAYVSRVLRGEKPADLPVLQPTKFELVINLKTAKALGLTVPPTLLARADEVIE